MESLISLPDYIKKEYDPFANPPDFSIALQHRKATLVGLSNNKINSKQCQCCLLSINKQPIDLRCKHIQLTFLGTSLVMYFNLLKVSIILLAAISIILAVLQAIILNKNYDCCIISTQILVSLSMETNGRIYFIITSWLLLTGLAYLLQRYSDKEIYIIQNSQPAQQDYTLILSNLPNTDQKQLKKMVQLCLGQKVTNIDLAYDIHQLHQAFLKREKLTIMKNRIEKSMFKHGIGLFNSQKKTSEINKCKSNLFELNNDINCLDQTLSKYKHYLTFTPYKQIGIAFVCFQSKKAAKAAFNRYQALVTGNQKQKLAFKQKEIIVQMAMNPKDVVWQNLNSQNKKTNQYIQFGAVFMGLIIIVFLILFLNNYRGMKSILNLNPKFVAFTIIFIIYSLFHMIVHFLVLMKRKLAKYSTHTSKQMSSLKIYLILNTSLACILPYLLHSNQEQLILYINFVTFLDALMHPLIKIFNCNHIYKKMLAEYIKNLQPCKNYFTQQYINRLLEGRQFRLGQNYHFICRGIFVTSFFSVAAPLCYLYYTFALMIQYIAQKILLLRFCKTPPKISRKIIYYVISCILYAPALFFLGTGVFKAQKEALQPGNYWLELLGLIISIGTAQLNIKEKSDEIVAGNDNYFISQLKFGQSYENHNPIKKYDGSINSLRSIPSQKFCSTPQWRDFEFLVEQRNKKEANITQMRSINRLMSYNNQYFDLFVSNQYKRLCDT